MLRWTQENIITEIRQLHAQGAALNYHAAAKQYVGLVKAAEQYFGTWRRAVESAGIDYDRVRKYQRWDRERIVRRIRELHAAGYDLSWRIVSTEVDPQLAHAAIRPKGFGSWRAAIAAAGLDYEEVARYRYWDRERILHEIQEMHHAGKPLSVSDVERSNAPLLWAARRRFRSWDDALVEAGIDPATERLHSSLQSTVQPTNGSLIFDSLAPKSAASHIPPLP
jgi:hypothetical protein